MKACGQTIDQHILFLNCQSDFKIMTLSECTKATLQFYLKGQTMCHSEKEGRGKLARAIYSVQPALLPCNILPL